MSSLNSITVDVSTVIDEDHRVIRVLLVAKGASNEKGFVEHFLGERLPERYTVRYFLDPGGPYLVKEGILGPVLHRFGMGLNVCFLPREWIGKRVNREHWEA